MVFDLVSYYYQLLVVTNTWACVPRATLRMRMKNSYKYPPHLTPSTFELANQFGLVREGWEGPLICSTSPSSYNPK